MLVTPTLVAAGVDPVNDIEWGCWPVKNRYIQVVKENWICCSPWPGEAWQLIGQGYDFKYIDGG
jgi:hypothetical protein